MVPAEVSAAVDAMLSDGVAVAVAVLVAVFGLAGLRFIRRGIGGVSVAVAPQDWREAYKVNPDDTPF